MPSDDITNNAQKLQQLLQRTRHHGSDTNNFEKGQEDSVAVCCSLHSDR